MRYLRQTTPWTRAVIGVLALAVAAIAVTVASASGEESQAPEGGAFGPDPGAFGRFRDCMSEHGVDLPEPPKRAQGRALQEPSSTEREAFEACQDQLPEPPRGACPAPGPPPEMAIPQD